MFKTTVAALLVATAGLVASTALAQAQTVKALILQDDSDETSLQSNSRIQRAVLNTWQQTMNAPASLSAMRRYGIDGIDVYDESIFLDVFARDPKVRRSLPQLIRTAELASNPSIDVLVTYTLYARAIQDPYTKVGKLVMSMSYRAIDVKSKRFFGGDNLDLARNGVPISGCATTLNGQGPDEHCVLELVSTFGEKLARDAGNAMALRLAALIGERYGNGGQFAGGGAVESGKDGGYDPDGGAPIDPAANVAIQSDESGTLGGEVVNAITPDIRSCPNIPTTFLVTFEQFTPEQLTFLETNLGQWKCALDLDAVGQSLANATYEYKTKANAGQALRSIRIILSQMGVDADIRPQSGNEVTVRAIGIRPN